METTKEFVNDYFNLTESCYTQIEKYPYFHMAALWRFFSQECKCRL